MTTGTMKVICIFLLHKAGIFNELVKVVLRRVLCQKRFTLGDVFKKECG